MVPLYHKNYGGCPGVVHLSQDLFIPGLCTVLRFRVCLYKGVHVEIFGLERLFPVCEMDAGCCSGQIMLSLWLEFCECACACQPSQCMPCSSPVHIEPIRPVHECCVRGAFVDVDDNSNFLRRASQPRKGYECSLLATAGMLQALGCECTTISVFKAFAGVLWREANQGGLQFDLVLVYCSG
jgi:hypothetical protein